MRAGDRIGRYEIVRVLSHRGIAQVCLAREPAAPETGTGREVALKLVWRDPREADRLEAEALGAALQRELAAQAPRVAAVYEVFDVDDYFVLAMEYVPGQDLKSELAAHGGRLPVPRALALCRDLLATLEICHGFRAEVLGRQVEGIIHGDIKPENLRLEQGRLEQGGPEDGDAVRILDFGASTYLTATHKVTRNAFGTYPYTPPERLASGGDVDEASDLWAVGILLYLMVSGQQPYPGTTPEQVERLLLTSPPQPLPPDCPERLRWVIGKALAFDRVHRYASAVAFRQDLEAYEAGAPLTADAVPDLDLTRRTPTLPVSEPPANAAAPAGAATPAGADRDATHRTAGLPPLPPVPPPPPGAATAGAEPGFDTGPVPLRAETAAAGVAAPSPAPPSAFRRFLSRRKKRWIAIVLALLVGSQTYVAREAGEIAQEARADATPDLDRLWARHNAASRYCLLGLANGSSRRALVAASLKAGETVFARYRADTPCDAERARRETVRSAEWQEACGHVHRARLATAGNREVAAADLYCQAQLERLAALEAKSADEKSQRLRTAVELFGDARKGPRAQDAAIGLMAIHAYHDPDFTRLVAALEDFHERGFESGRRELAIEADAYRGEGKRLWRLVAVARGNRLRCPEELSSEHRAQLKTAKKHLEHAIELYQSPLASSCSWVRSARREAESLSGDIEACLETHHPAPWLFWLFH